MTLNSVLLFAFATVAIALLASRIVYVHEQRKGYSHEASLTSSVLFNCLLIGTSVLNCVFYIIEFE